MKYASNPDSGRFQVKNVHDLSEGGLSFLTNLKLDTGSKLKIWILLPPNETLVSMDATVVRCPSQSSKRPLFRASIRFVNISAEENIALREVLARFFKNDRLARVPRFVIRRRD